MSQSTQIDQRRYQLRQRKDWQGNLLLNGLDYLEIDASQTILMVYFIGKLPPEFKNIDPTDKSIYKKIKLTGGRRIPASDIQITKINSFQSTSADEDDCLQLHLNKAGDFSTYRIQLVGVKNLDQRYDHLDFSFKVDCPSELDWATSAPQATPQQAMPDLNYLSKDYATFRQLMLDRLALNIPEWKERHVPDLGIALVETMAYVADYLSYYQDAVATEAYLDTARQRISVRRHARLVDYTLHEGCNARTWVCLSCENNQAELQLNNLFFSTVPTQWERTTDYANDSLDNELFQPVLTRQDEKRMIYAAHNRIYFHTWGGEQPCLPKGATSASLLDIGLTTLNPKYKRISNLKVGDVLIFEEVRSPSTGLHEDADIMHRHAVRLTAVTPNEDNVILDDCKNPTQVLDIQWHAEDALPFALCLTAMGNAPLCQEITHVSVARGNVLLVDYGHRKNENLGVVPALRSQQICEDIDMPSDVTTKPGRFNPTLKFGPLVYAQPLPDNAWQLPASAMLKQEVRKALPSIRITNGVDWTPVTHLLNSEASDNHVVVEIDNDSRAHLRFGDGELGAQPPANTQFSAEYRVGSRNVTRSNIGAEYLRAIGSYDWKPLPVTSVRNPLPAGGAIAPESLTEARLMAPMTAKKLQLRAITAQDYADIAKRELGKKIQRAAASLDWTGSHYQVQVVLDPAGDNDVETELKKQAEDALHLYRRMGHDIAIKTAQYVPLTLEMTIFIKPHILQGYVLQAVRDVLSNRQLPNNQLGFFHPDRLTFGQSIYISQLIAAAQAITGVQAVEVTKLQRKFIDSNSLLAAEILADGVLSIGPLEVAQLDNDPNFPENGNLILKPCGGR